MEPRMDQTQRPGGRPDQPWLMLKPRQQIAAVKTIDDQARPPGNGDASMYRWHRNPCLPRRLKHKRFPVHDIPLRAREGEAKHPPSIKRVNLSFSPRGEQHQLIQVDLHGHRSRIVGAACPALIAPQYLTPLRPSAPGHEAGTMTSRDAEPAYRSAASAGCPAGRPPWAWR